MHIRKFSEKSGYDLKEYVWESLEGGKRMDNGFN